MTETERQVSLYRAVYGRDTEYNGAAGFYWPESPSKRKEVLSVKRNNPDVFQSTYQCRPGGRTGSIFLESDFKFYTAPRSIAQGYGSIHQPDVKLFCSQGESIIAGWDTAFESTAKADPSVGITALLVPCQEYHCGEDPRVFGECEPHLDVFILDVKIDRVDWGGLPSMFMGVHQRWNHDVHVIEKRASGIPLYQMMNSAGMPVVGVNTAVGKRARAVEGTEAGSAQGWFRRGRVIFPDEAPWLENLKTELKDFTGDESSKDDQVDAIVHLINHAISLGGASVILPSAVRNQTTGALDPIRTQEMFGGSAYEEDPRAVFLSNLSLLEDSSFDMYDGTCGRCKAYNNARCHVLNRPVTAFDTCDKYESARTLQ